ncbi:hypothetical protein DPMN_096585 [Dreissena polymorpha]|uniref:Uncharacterized protein n=1 Tax=Dreissena polymorpha TaxID=45954 RepID=A0A9D4L9F9_DREPO|nr:hypothetical protein DPMN_096585 [Dreissena polymorpha]
MKEILLSSAKEVCFWERDKEKQAMVTTEVIDHCNKRRELGHEETPAWTLG